jgi:hypothetical protein
MSNPAPITLVQLFRFKRPWGELPHQDAAVQQLSEALSAPGAAYSEIMRRDQPWFHTWSQDGKQPAPAGTPTWRNMVDLAQQAGAKFPELVAAQGALESAWYASPSGKHNYFGLKGEGTTKETREFLNGQWVTIRDNFLDFATPWAAVEYLVTRWYKDFRDHKGINRAANRDEAAQLLVREGYATDPQYATKLIRIMDEQAPKPPAAPPSPPLVRVTPASPFSALLTPHIRVGEFALDREERRFHHQYQVDTATELAAFLERVRTRFDNKPIIITSGYRPPSINRSVGGASASEHLFNAPGVGAVDFYVQNEDIRAVEHWCVQHWPYSVGLGAPKGFVHLGIRAGRPRVRWDY